MAVNPYNNIYKTLAQDNGDAVGMFAYALYKQQKIAFVEKIIVDEQRDPTDVELSVFHTTSMLPQSINGYREQGEALVSAFLTESLAKRVEQIQNDVRDSVVISRLEAIENQINSNKTWLGWLKDIFGNLFENIVTILLIGCLVVGYKYLSELNQKQKIYQV